SWTKRSPQRPAQRLCSDRCLSSSSPPFLNSISSQLASKVGFAREKARSFPARGLTTGSHHRVRRAARNGRSVGVLMNQPAEEGHPQDLDVQPGGPVGDVVEVELEPLAER